MNVTKLALMQINNVCYKDKSVQMHIYYSALLLQRRLINFTDYFPFNNCLLILFASTSQFRLPSSHGVASSWLGSNFRFRRGPKTARYTLGETVATVHRARWCHLRSPRAIKSLAQPRPLPRTSSRSSINRDAKVSEVVVVGETPETRSENAALLATRPIDRDFDTRLRLSGGTKARSGHASTVREESCNGEIGRTKRTRHRGDANATTTRWARRFAARR